MKPRRHEPPVRWPAAALLALLIAGTCVAAEPKDYAYLFVQGRVSTGATADPVPGATVRLVGSDATHETTTDDRGVFVFDPLPVDSYEVEVLDSAGRRIRGARTLQRIEADRARIALKPADDDPSRVRLEAGPERVALVVDNPTVDRRKFWKQAAIFFGAAGLLAL